MTNLAILADIHGNRFALDAVVADLTELGIAEVIVAGDLVGRGPQGDDVVQRIQELGWSTLRGNHEDYLLSFVRNDIPAAWRVDEEWAASRWMAAELSEDSIRFLEALPFSLQAEADPQIEIFHGSPHSHTEGIGPWVKPARLEEHLSAISGNILICAHTHRPMHYQSSAGEIINVGSVGLPFNRNWRAQYVILSGSPGNWKVTFRNIEYPRNEFLRYYETSGFLSNGGLTARLLYQEVREARPFLVPFLKWAAHHQKSPRSEDLEEFFSFYEPIASLKSFFQALGHKPDLP